MWNNMVSPCMWMVVFVFIWKIKSVNGMIVSPNRMTWMESLSYCKLASEDSVHNLRDREYRGWIGGIYLNSQWMFHKGCYSNTGAIDVNKLFLIEKLSPSLCSDKCKKVPYFAMKRKWCFCTNSLHNLKNVDSSKCTYKCPGSNKDVCGENSHYTVYKQITGVEKPNSDADQKLACSVVEPRNETFALKPVDCFSRYRTACVISGDTKQLGIADTYETAIIRCASLNGTLPDVTHSLNHLEDGKEYWSTIYRSKFLKWVTSESFDEICDEVKRLLNVECLFLEVNNSDMKFTPLPCKYEYKAICEHKKPGDSIVIRQCQTKMYTTIKNKEESETSSISSTKPPLTSSHLSDATAYLRSFRTSMSSPFTIIVKASSSKRMSTTVTFTQVSENKNSVLSITDDISFVSSLSTTTYTTASINTKYASQDITLDSENRTVEYETTYNSLVFNVLVFLVPVSAALLVLVIMTVLLIVRQRRKRRKAHTKGIGHHFELDTRQPIIENENRKYEKPWDYLKPLITGIPECQIYDEAEDQESFERQIYDVPTDQYQHLQFDQRRKQSKFLEAEYDSSMSKLSFPNPDLDKTSANSAIKIVVAKHAQNMRSSIHVGHGPKTNNKSAGQNVAYCDTEIIHTKYLYDTPKKSAVHANIP